MDQLINTYQNYKIDVKAVIPGAFSSFLYAYCKTVNCPDHLEQTFIRKSVSLAKLAKHVRMNITNDFDLWYRKNEDSPELLQVLSNIINAEDGRVDTYRQAAPVKKLVSNEFYLPGFPLPVVLVAIK